MAEVKKSRWWLTLVMGVVLVLVGTIIGLYSTVGGWTYALQAVGVVVILYSPYELYKNRKKK